MSATWRHGGLAGPRAPSEPKPESGPVRSSGVSDHPEPLRTAGLLLQTFQRGSLLEESRIGVPRLPVLAAPPGSDDHTGGALVVRGEELTGEIQPGRSRAESNRARIAASHSASPPGRSLVVVTTVIIGRSRVPEDGSRPRSRSAGQGIGRSADRASMRSSDISGRPFVIWGWRGPQSAEARSPRQGCPYRPVDTEEAVGSLRPGGPLVASCSGQIFR